MQDQHLLIIGLVWPEPNSSAAGTRMLQLIDLFLARGCKITFASAAGDSDYMFDVTAIGIDKAPILMNDSSFDDFVKALNPTMVLFDRFVVEEQFGWRVSENCPAALRILDTVDLHFLRLARQKAFIDKVDVQQKDLFSDTAKREIASILRCDISLVISEFEMELLLNDFKIDSALLFYLPFMVDPVTDATIQSWPEFNSRKDFIFIGNFLHEPNWNAVQYLKQDIWPRVHILLPDAAMRIYGAYPSQKVLQFHNPAEKFYIMGRAENAHEVVEKARVVLAPIRFGAGAKGKLIEAMQCGTPSVATSIGAEGMPGNLKWNGIIADGIDEFVNGAVELYQNEILWKQSQRNGIEIIKERYSKSPVEKAFVNYLRRIQSDLDRHRLNNFIGAILMHHTLASTKYMSRWIEIKNKK